MGSIYDRPAMIAMGASYGAAAARCPSKEEPPGSERRPVEPRPPVDERLVTPEMRYEVVDGRVLHVAPAGEPHGTAHMDLAAVLRAHVTRDYRGAVDMLTRTKQVGDHAPDASVYPTDRDPATGGRKLEELAFEIVSEQAMSVATAKARAYVERGVRRVFCIDVQGHRVLEWSHSLGGWEDMPEDGVIADPCFVQPLPVKVLLDAAAVDDSLADALIAKKNRRIQRALAAAMAETLLRVLEARSVPLTAADRELVKGCSDPDQLTAWTSRAAVATRREEVFGG